MGQARHRPAVKPAWNSRPIGRTDTAAAISNAAAARGRPTHAMEVLLMQSTIHAARRRGHLSRHERQRNARAEAFSRRTPTTIPREVPVKLGQELELIQRLVRHDRTAVSSALLAIGGIGAGEEIRGVVLAQLSEAAFRAQAEGVISAERGGQIARHVSRAQDADLRVTA
jgi:hypothetical protein